MLFNSLSFFAFFPVFCALYFLTRGRVRLWCILLASYFFYSWWDVRLLPILLAMTWVNYFLGQKIRAAVSDSGRRRVLTAGVCLNLGVLGTFKYLGFLAGAALAVLHAAGLSVPEYALRIILPVGISFYIFEMIS